ncbi:MAG TPA: hypothetical protein VFQ43_00735 [Nitrososphaera sp.]|nr:hypothetical protein [Nitrososphaera sp.]
MSFRRLEVPFEIATGSVLAKQTGDFPKNTSVDDDFRLLVLNRTWKMVAPLRSTRTCNGFLPGATLEGGFDLEESC